MFDSVSTHVNEFILKHMQTESSQIGLVVKPLSSVSNPKTLYVNVIFIKSKTEI